MIITFDIDAQAGKVTSGGVVVQGADVPVQIVFSRAPGAVGGIEVGLGSDVVPSALLAYTDTFSQVNDTTWEALLDLTDSRLATFMAAGNKGPTAVDVELVTILDGKREIAPHVQVTVQPPIIPASPGSEGGPTYLTDTQTASAIAAAVAPLALKTVSGKYRIKGDGTFQLWNADQSKFHTLTVSGAAGAEQLNIAAGE